MPIQVDSSVAAVEVEGAGHCAAGLRYIETVCIAETYSITIGRSGSEGSNVQGIVVAGIPPSKLFLSVIAGFITR